MIFDGKKGVRFTYNGKEYKEVIIPNVAEDDPDLEGIWQYRLDTGDDNLSMVLHGSYDDEGNLSTYDVLQVRVQDAATDTEEYIDDIDVIGMEEVAEKKKVWVMTQESNVDGEISFNVIVCDSEQSALNALQREKDWIKNDSFHFRDYEERGDDFEVEQSEHRFFINDETDDYYEEIMVMEKEIITL